MKLLNLSIEEFNEIKVNKPTGKTSDYYKFMTAILNEAVKEGESISTHEAIRRLARKAEAMGEEIPQKKLQTIRQCYFRSYKNITKDV